MVRRREYNLSTLILRIGKRHFHEVFIRISCIGTFSVRLTGWQTESFVVCRHINVKTGVRESTVNVENICSF